MWVYEGMTEKTILNSFNCPPPPKKTFCKCDNYHFLWSKLSKQADHNSAFCEIKYCARPLAYDIIPVWQKEAATAGHTLVLILVSVTLDKSPAAFYRAVNLNFVQT